MAKAKNEAKIRFTAETQDFNKAIQAASSTVTELRSELALNQTEMKGMSDTTDKLVERKKILQKQFEVTAQKTDALRGKLEVAARIYGENSTEAQKLRTAVNNATNAQEKAWQELQKTNKELAEQEAAAKDTRTALEKLEDTITEQQTKIEGMCREYANAVLQFGKNSKEAKGLAKDIKDLSKDLDTNKKKLQDAGGAAEDAGNDAANSAEGWTIVKDVIADMASQAIQAAADAFQELLFNGEAALDMLQARTGASSADMERFGDVAYDVFNAGFGASIEDVTTSMGTVVTMMGDLNDAELQTVTENVMTLSDVFGWDTTESLRAVNSMMNQFGISSDQAFNLMVQGAQNGLDQNGDLLDTVNEYSVQFAQAGFSANDMFNMLVNGANEGTWSVDKLGDAFKEYNIRVSDGTVGDALMENRKVLGLTKKEAEALAQAYTKGGKEGQEAMTSTLEMIMGVEDETERYKLGVAMFGTMWEDLGEDAIMALYNTEGAIYSTNDAMGQTKTDAYSNLATTVSQLGRTLKNELVMPLVESVAPAFTAAFQWALDNLHILKPIIVGLAAAFGVLAIALGISGIISTVQRAFALLNTTLLANPIVLVIAVLAGLVAAFIYLWNNCEAFREFWINLWMVIKQWASDSWTAISGFFTSAWQWIQNAWSGAGEWFSGVYQKITGAFASIGSWFSGKFQAAWSGIQSAWSSVSSWFSNTYKKITNAFSSVGSWFASKFTSAWSGIKSAWSGVTGWFSDTYAKIKNTFSSVGSWFRSTFSAAWTAVKNVFSGWGSFFGNLWSQIKDKFSSIGTNISNAISGAVRSGINGVISMIERTINSAIGLINGAIGLINKLPGVSVSRVNTVSLPRLAAGGVLYGETAFVGGEYPGAATNPEIVAPQNIMQKTFADTLESYMGSGSNTDMLERLIDAVEDMADRAINLYVDSTRIAEATAGANDSVNGNRLNLRNRGLALP